MARATKKPRKKPAKKPAKKQPVKAGLPKLRSAFKVLNDAGIVAMHRAGYTMSEGWEDVNEIARQRRDAGSKPRGATFYHGQDVERGRRGEGVNLAFGAYVTGKKHDAASVAIAQEIVDTLKAHGFKPIWDGTVGQRIHTGRFPWTRSKK